MKLIRADEHLDALQNEVADFLRDRPYEIVTRKKVRAGYRSVRVVYRRAPPDRLLMLIGDVLQNLRSALDHLAWSLAGAKAGRYTEFPIFHKRGRYRRSGLGKMHDMSLDAQRIIESLQPYHGRHGPPEREPLWLLHELSIEDKHRAINLVAAGVDVQVDVSTSDKHPAYGLTGRTGNQPLKDGEEI